MVKIIFYAIALNFTFAWVLRIFIACLAYTISMLLLSAKLHDQSVLSLRTGGKVAVANRPIFNPNNLQVVGFYCTDHFSGNELILLAQDIREHIRQGYVVNDHEVLASPDDLVRLKTILLLEFELMGKSVISNHKRHLGKVSDYAVDSESLYVQKLYVSPRLLKSLTGSPLSIDRSQVIEISDKQIIVQEATKTVNEAMPAQATA